jgi:2-hydroxy-3-keto-5-methylthiopentenyl-1-phosphate phosphatase
MRPPWAIVCDFDGTVTTHDVGDQVSIRFAGYHVWRGAEDAYKAGAYDFGALIRRIFEPITASRDEIAAFARQRAVLRPGFERLVAACRDGRRPFVVCSAGLDVYIEPVLERLAPDLRNHVDVRCNRAVCSPAGMRVTFHADGEGCGRCGFCKGSVVRDLRAAGYKVLVVGDGTADRCAAEAADFVFARARLADWCAASGIAHRPFETFEDVIDGFPPGSG